jgi:hypothetical protein
MCSPVAAMEPLMWGAARQLQEQYKNITCALRAIDSGAPLRDILYIDK